MAMADIKHYLKEKRQELIWALSKQDYSLADIAAMFNTSKTAVHRVVNKMPEGWETPWTKIR